MVDIATRMADWWKLTGKVSQLYTQRIAAAQQSLCAELYKTATDLLPLATRVPAGDGWSAWSSYATDALQRWILFWDTIRQRGNTFLEHERAGKPPALVYDYELVVDGRKLPRPVNYALLRIIPPSGMAIDESKRPFLIVDPRAGHGPGIGGFKEDSEVGVALKAGHPVYFVIFYPEPVPGQTLRDVGAAEAEFVRTIVRRHPQSPRPVIVGNCQGGWAVMLLAAAQPDLIGPLVINGAPVSYWGGNDGQNPMRYAGGLLGGSWTALLASDLGNGKFDGAHLVQNFENLNPANTFWDKYYHVFANADTEPPRFLDFERWWGGFYLMNENEIRWIVNNLFIGNKLARGEVKAAPHSFLDLKTIRSPIVVFASAGDNITPPQQAFNWIADVYESTEEIKANGQVIVGLFHESVGHLGIFVSGKVAKKEHAQIVEVLEYIQHLRPGLYLMRIAETKTSRGRTEYEVTLEERELEDLRRLNKYERRDEKPFEAVAQVSDLLERAYELCGRPMLRPLVNETTAALGRMFHPLRWQRWAFSDLNPCMWPLPSLASAVKIARQPCPPDNACRQAEKMASQAISASLDLYRDLRDAAGEALFFQVYGSLLALGMVTTRAAEEPQPAGDPRQLPFVQEALAAIDRGGYPEALARIGALLGRAAGPIPLSRLQLLDEFLRSDKVLSRLSEDEVRRLRSEQAVIATLEPERALQSLPGLLADPADRKRVLATLARATSVIEPTREQRAILERIRAALGANDKVPALAAAQPD